MPDELDRLFGRLDALFAGPHSRRPEPPLGDARHQFQPALGQPQPPVERLQPPLDLGRGDHLVGQTAGNRFQADVLVSHAGSASQVKANHCRRRQPELASDARAIGQAK